MPELDNVIDKQPKDAIKELAEIAIELLNRYKTSQTIVNNLHGTGTNLDIDFKRLNEECETYANRITNLSGVEFEVKKNWWEKMRGV